MDNTVDKLIQDQIDALPPDIKKAISLVPWKDRVRDIAKRENLNITQSDSLETETLLILYGLLPPESYAGNIVTEVGVDEEQAERIAKLVNDEIIADIEKQFEAIDATAQKSALTPALETPTGTPATQSVEIPEANLPEVIPGEAAHNVPHIEELPKAPTTMPGGMIGDKLTQATSVLPQTGPKISYSRGVDPYREPIE